MASGCARPARQRISAATTTQLERAINNQQPYLLDARRIRDFNALCVDEGAA